MFSECCCTCTVVTLCCFQEVLATARGCGFQNECGIIWFSLLVTPLHSPDETEQLYQIYLSRAVTQIELPSSALLSLAVSHLTVLSGARCVKRVVYRQRGYYLLNCTVRLQTGIPLSRKQKRELLYAVSRRLFFISPSLRDRCSVWLSRNPYCQFSFLTSGILLRDAVCMRMAMKTMSLEVSVSAVPPLFFFLPHAVLFLSACRSLISATIRVGSVSYSSVITQPVCLRSMLKTMCPPDCWAVVSRGVCYLPGYRNSVSNGVEEWEFHVHGEYGGEHTGCGGACEQCLFYQPASLFQTAQLMYLRNLFMRRRARVTHCRASPFF
uniref:ORF13 protein n=1 Tax=Psittacine aviadenovirus B TaxID=2169709 RepID=A0AB38ZPC4_9ADEN